MTRGSKKPRKLCCPKCKKTFEGKAATEESAKHAKEKKHWGDYNIRASLCEYCKKKCKLRKDY